MSLRERNGRKSLPSHGIAWSELQQTMSELRSGDADWRHGRTPLHVYYPGEDVLDVARQAYGMFLCENALAPAAFPSLKRMQDEVVDMAISLLGGGANASGTLTSGGTESIILAVRSAWRSFRERNPHARQPHLLLPASAHPAWDKAAELMRLEVVRVPHASDFAACAATLERHITADTVMIVASAPSLPFGIVDPVEPIASLAVRHGIWLHVDACIGGFIAPHVARFRDDVPRFDLSVPGVRSISADLHKFGYTAKGASVLLYADAADQRWQHFEFADWPKGVYRTESLGGTRPGGAIAAAWAVMHYLGEAGYMALAQRVMRIRDRYVEGIQSIPGLRLLGQPQLSVIAFTSDSHDIHEVGDELEARGWYVSRLSTPPGLHMTVSPAHDLAVDDYLEDLASSVASLGSGLAQRHQRSISTY